MTKSTILILLGCIIMLFACIDTIEFDQPKAIENTISIQGKLTKGNPSRVAVQISEVFNFSEVSRLIDAKYVQLIDDSGNEVALISRIQGIYQLDILPEMPLKVEYGKGYQIKTELNNGEIYESTFDTLYPIVEPQDLTVRKVQELTTNLAGTADTVNLMQFRTSTTFPTFNSKKVSLLWELQNVFKLSDTPDVYPRCPRDCQPTNSAKASKTCYVTINPVQNYRVVLQTCTFILIPSFLLL